MAATGVGETGVAGEGLAVRDGADELIAGVAAGLDAEAEALEGELAAEAEALGGELGAVDGALAADETLGLALAPAAPELAGAPEVLAAVVLGGADEAACPPHPAKSAKGSARKAAGHFTLRT